MAIKFRESIFASVLAFILATACCWLPWLLIALGGAVGVTGWSEGLSKISGPFMLLGIMSFSYGLFQIYKNKNTVMELELKSRITCPACKTEKIELMPTDACQFFYECTACHKILKPLVGDCCVFCSYGTVQCPPMQGGEGCCK